MEAKLFESSILMRYICIHCYHHRIHSRQRGREISSTQHQPLLCIVLTMKHNLDELQLPTKKYINSERIHICIARVHS